MSNRYEDLDVVGVDHGFGYIKTRNFKFRSSIEVSNAEPPNVKDTVLYQGKYYTCGIGKKISVTTKKTQNEDAFIFTLLGVARELERKEKQIAKIHLAVGLPIKDFFDKNYREEFQRYFENRPSVKYFVDGEEYYIDIESASVYPQGYAAIGDQITERFSKMAISLLCDMGSLTTDIAPMIEGKLDRGNAESIRDNGLRQIFARIAGDVHQKHRVKLADVQVEEILIHNDTYGINKEIQNSVKESAKKYILALVTMIEEFGYQRGSCPFIFIGGGATVIKNLFNAGEISGVEVIEGLNLNAIGYEKIALAKIKAGKL